MIRPLQRRRRIAATPTAVAAVVALAASACGSSGTPDVVEAPDGAVDAVVREVPHGLGFEEDGPTATDVTVIETARLDLAATEPETWCVAVDAVATEPGHWLDGRSIWLAAMNDDGTWRASPTALNAVHLSWEVRCGFADPGDY